MQKLITILLVFIAFSGFAQKHEIVGYAPAFVGKKAELYTYQDYITMTRVKLGEGMVSPEDSLFHIDLNIGTTVKGIIVINKTEAPLYLDPKTSYDIYFPEAEDQPTSFQNRRSEILFFGLDSTDINYRVLQYYQWFDTFVAYYEEQIAGGRFLTYLDTFKLYAQEAYKDVEDEYFITFVRYNIAQMQQTFGGNAKSAKRLETFLNYIQPFPLYYENDQYMKFFRGFYSQNFDDLAPAIEIDVNQAIAQASPTMLMAALKKDLFLANPEIREMVMIDKLGKQFYERNDQKRNILVILDSLTEFAAFPGNRTVAKNVKRYLTSLEPGFPAPTISLVSEKDTSKTISWKKYEGKFVYFNFFETWNDQARTDMRIIAELKKKYGEYVSFLSVCTNENKEDYERYMKENPEYDWDIVYVGSDSHLKSDYRVSIVPAYFLIDQSGFIALAPAPTPSPDGEYESIDKTFFYIKRALSPTHGNHVGDP
ncbi:MAG: redoxin domain-containing protein [Crocinitomicaceae bacterium]|nr:redoxin domain-containing protein [Crocinitomicaceae bacterium]